MSDFSSGGRQKNVSGESGSVERHGSGLGTGSVGNNGGYSGRPGGEGGSSEGGTRSFSDGGGRRGFDPRRAYRNASRGGSKSGCVTKIIGVIFVFIVLSWLFRACFGSTEEQTAEMQTVQTETQVQDSQSSQTSQSTQTADHQPITLSNQNGVLNTEVRSGSRIKYTDVENAKTATVLVYICGSNLESENGMATSDLQEMIKAGIGENDAVKTIVYTGGASQWKNNVVSRRTNQIYRVLGEGMERLVEDDGDKAMTDPETLASFITYGVTNYPADRYMLILWDHGAGSILGYGYDEKHTSRGYMSLGSIQDALQKAGVRFDFIGYDACLMATVSNGLMLAEFADYMIASEETEPGTGWYYTGWLKALNQNPAISTVELGKIIADDYTSASAQYQRSATTTLSVTDLAELKTFLREPFDAFSVSTSELLNSDAYSTVSNARANTKEFAVTEGIDQVDMVHLALNMNTQEGDELARALQSAVKYNRTSYGYEKAYGLSEYFPWHRDSQVDTAIDNYGEIGLEGEYTNTIRTFANMQLSGQIASGGSSGSYGSLFGSLFGGNGQNYTGYNDYSGYGPYESNGYNGYYGGYGSADYYNGNGYAQDGSIDLGTVVDLIYLFTRKSTVPGVNGNSRFVDTKLMQNFSTYVAKNSINPKHLTWVQNGDHKTLAFDDRDWDASSALLLSMFVDDGSGFIDLGLDNVYEFDSEKRLIGETDGTWLALNGQIVAYYFLDANLDGEEFSVLFYNADESEALCNDILQICRNQEYNFGGETVVVTISIGLVKFKGFSLTGSSDVITEADNNLYASKQNGKDQMTISDLRNHSKR